MRSNYACLDLHFYKGYRIVQQGSTRRMNKLWRRGLVVGWSMCSKRMYLRVRETQIYVECWSFKAQVRTFYKTGATELYKVEFHLKQTLYSVAKISNTITIIIVGHKLKCEQLFFMQLVCKHFKLNSAYYLFRLLFESKYTICKTHIARHGEVTNICFVSVK